MSISRATWMKSLSDLWLKPGYARGGRSRRTSRFNNARFASGWAAGVEMLESRAMLASDIVLTWVPQGDGFNSLYVALPNESTNPISVTVQETGTTQGTEGDLTLYFKSSTAIPAVTLKGGVPGTVFQLNSTESSILLSDYLTTSLYIDASSGATPDGITTGGYTGYFDVVDTVLLQTVPSSTGGRTGNLSNIVSISAKTITFDNDMFINSTDGEVTVTASLAANGVGLQTVDSILLNTTGLPYLGSITVNSPAAAGQPFAGDGSLVGPDWGSLGYAAGQSIQISLTNNGAYTTYPVTDVIGDTLYITNASPGSGVYSNAAVRGLICPYTYEASLIDGLIPQVVANYVSLTTTGDGSTIEGAIAPFYNGNGTATCVLSGGTYNGNINLEVVANTHATTNQTQLNFLNAGTGEINLAVNGELVNDDPTTPYVPWPELIASAVGLYITGTNSNIGADSTFGNPLTTASYTGAPLSLTVYAENAEYINIQDLTPAGVIINSITANQGGQAPTVSNGQVEYNSTPSSTTPSYKPGNSNIVFSASGPIILGSVSATGSATFSGSSILEGEGQSQNIIATSVSLTATGVANYTGSVQFIPGAPDTLKLSPAAGTDSTSLGFAGGQTIFISAATSASNNGSFVIAPNGVSSDGSTLTLSSSYAVTAATGVVVIGNGVIGQPGTQANGSSNSISLTTVPYFQAYAPNGSIYLSLGGQVNSTAVGVGAYSSDWTSQPSSAIIQSQAPFLTVQSVVAQGGLASIAMSNGTIFQYGQTTTNTNGQTTYTPPTVSCIVAPTVSLTSPYDIGTSLYPLVIAADGILLNMTATTATSAGAYIENLDYSGNGGIPSTIGVTTYGGNVYINNSTVATSTPMLKFEGNILSQAPLATLPTLTFSNTNGDHGSAGNVIISGLLNVDTIMAGIDVNGQAGSGQIIFSSLSDVISGVGAGGGPVTLIAATGIGTSAFPVMVGNVATLTAITNVGDIFVQEANGQTTGVDLAASTTNGNISAYWLGDIALNNAISVSSTDDGGTPQVILNSISAPTGTVTLKTSEGDLVNDGSYGISANALTLTIAGAIGSSSNPVQITTASTLTAFAGVGAIWVNSNTALTVASATASGGPLSITAMGDISLQGNVYGTTTSLTATNGTVTQTGGTIGNSATTNITISANSIGATTGVIQAYAPIIDVTANDGGIYLSNNNSANLLLTAVAIGTASGTTANNVEISSAGTIELLQKSTALTQLASPLPMGVFNPGGDLTLVAGQTTITSSATTALATCSANSYGGGTVSGGTVTSAGSGYLSLPTVTITGGGGSGATATAALSGGTVSGITITNPGTGYTSAPTVTISPPGDDVYTGTFTINGSSVASSFPSLVIISGTAEISPTTTSTGIPALVTLPDLTAFAAANANPTTTIDGVTTYNGTVPLLNGVGTETITTDENQITTVTITAPQGQGVTIGYLGQNGKAGTATIPNGWSLVINATEGSVVFLNLEDTIATTGGGTITINAGTDVADVAALGNLTTVGGDITISAGGNIALSTLTTGSASSGGEIAVTSTYGAIIFNEDGQNLNAGVTTLTQFNSAVSSAQTNDLARAQLNATQVIAAANLTNANLLATYEGTLAQANAQLTLVKSLSAAMQSMQSSMATAQTAYSKAQSTMAAQQAKVTDDQNNALIFLNSEHSLSAAAASLGVGSSVTAEYAVIALLIAAGIIQVPIAGATAEVAAVEMEFLAATLELAHTDTLNEADNAQSYLNAANNQLINDLIILVQDESNLAAASAQVQAARATLTALAAAYDVAFQSYTYSTQMLSQEKTRSAEMSAQGAYYQGNAIVGVVFASPSQPISSTGAVTINALGSLTVTPSTDTVLTVTGAPAAGAPALALTFNAGGLSAAYTGTTFQAGSGSSAPKQVNFSGFGSVTTLNGTGNFTLTGTSNSDAMTLQANSQQAGTATLNGTQFSFTGMNGFQYLGAGGGDNLRVTPLALFASQVPVPWNLAVQLDGGTGGLAHVTYDAQNPYVDVETTGTNKALIVEPGIATVGLNNVSQVTVNAQGTANVLNLPTLAFTVPTNVTYNAQAHYANPATINGGASLDGITPTFTYYRGTMVHASRQVAAPINAGQYTVICSWPGDDTYAPATSSQLMTISSAPASTVVFTSVPASGTAGSALNAIQATVQDGSGNTVTSNTSTVTIAVASGPAGFTTGSTLTATTVNGVATFSNLILSTTGTYTFTVTDGSLTSATTGSITINAAAASKVVLTSVPTIGTAGSALTAIEATVQDAFGNTVTLNTSTVTMGIASGPAGFTSGSTLTATAVNGVATFNTLILNTTGTYTFTATDGSLTPATTGSITINAAAASKVAFTQLPTTGTAGSALTAILATVQDAFGNTITSNTSTVTIAVATGPVGAGFTAGSTTQVAAVNGVATFSNLILSTTGTYTFTVTDGSLTSATTGSITINAAAASKVVLTSVPTIGTAGSALTAIEATFQDGSGNTVTSNTSTVTIAVATGPVGAGFTAGSTTQVAAVNGVATFNNLILNMAGTYTFTVTDGSLTSSTTGSITINAAGAFLLAFNSSDLPPSTGTAGGVLAPIQVVVYDSYGNTVTSNTSTVTLAVASGPAGFTSGSTLTATAVNGVATFSNLTLNTAGTYSLHYTDGSLWATNSNVVISPAAATAVVFTQTPATGLAGSKLASYTAIIKDAYGNTVTTDTSTVTIAVKSGPGGFTPGSTLTAKAVRGVATFKNLTLTASGTYRLTATSGLLTSATTGNVVVNAAAASKVVVAQVPATGTAGSQLASITATVKDAYGNTVTSNTATRSIVVKSGPGGFTAGSTRTAKAVGGVATFGDLTLTKAGTYTFAVMAGSKTVAITGKIVIAPAAASKLVVTQSPKTGTAGAVLPVLKVVIEDTYGNVVVSNPSPITITVKTGPLDAGFAPSSTQTATAVKGIATFSNLFLNRSGTYTFTATDGSLTSAITRSLVVKAAAASKLVMIQTPSTGSVNSPLGAMRVAVVDAYDNVTPTAKFVTLSISSGPLGGSFASGSTRSVVPVNGVATFTNLKLSKAGTYTLKASAGLWASATSGEVMLNAN